MISKILSALGALLFIGPAAYAIDVPGTFEGCYSYYDEIETHQTDLVEVSIKSDGHLLIVNENGETLVDEHYTDFHQSFGKEFEDLRRGFAGYSHVQHLERGFLANLSTTDSDPKDGQAFVLGIDRNGKFAAFYNLGRGFLRQPFQPGTCR